METETLATSQQCDVHNLAHDFVGKKIADIKNEKAKSDEPVTIEMIQIALDFLPEHETEIDGDDIVVTRCGVPVRLKISEVLKMDKTPHWPSDIDYCDCGLDISDPIHKRNGL